MRVGVVLLPRMFEALGLIPASQKQEGGGMEERMEERGEKGMEELPQGVNGE